jgi:hypothetical protein
MTRWYLAAVAVFALCGSARGQDEKKDPPKKQATVDLDELFKKLDADGDGKISKDEFKKLTEHYKPARTGGFGGIRRQARSRDAQEAHGEIRQGR